MEIRVILAALALTAARGLLAQPTPGTVLWTYDAGAPVISTIKFTSRASRPSIRLPRQAQLTGELQCQTQATFRHRALARKVALSSAPGSSALCAHLAPMAH